MAGLFWPGAALSEVAIWLDDGHGTQQVWHAECNETGCMARTGDLQFFFVSTSEIWVKHPKSTSARVSVFDGWGTVELPNLFFHPVTPAELGHLARPRHWLVLEFPDRPTTHIPLAGLASIIEAWAPNAINGSVPNALQHLSDTDPANSVAPWNFVPHTKPQIEFAIHAQGGNSIDLGR
ncbi:hypothetical protein ACMU_11840 [Actibacterium mucosum KCTC 23349]|uniref:Uncharacterized protein n=1 Tax=Actibacterium mucosum KCTC 23349 TaxID=1454373 RepID=A0A037ZFZ7_9RHOB|nr:hypothetical protein ACMU_11840 [Actibacterium mucosum KCTC 23349]